MPTFDLLTIGHSNIPADRFIGLLRGVGVNAIADVRSTPASRRFPWFSAKNLAARLQQEGMVYLLLGDMLGGRPRDASLYRDGVADYEAMAKRPEFRAGLDRLLATTAQHRVCLMCAEREPLDCHRCLLVARALAERGLSVGHILFDGTITPHAAIEQQLLSDYDASADLFSAGQSERLAAAYRRRARAVAYRAKAVPSGASTAAESR
jgi:uncharacterized protein (DUF488 family)